MGCLLTKQKKRNFWNRKWFKTNKDTKEKRNNNAVELLGAFRFEDGQEICLTGADKEHNPKPKCVACPRDSNTSTCSSGSDLDSTRESDDVASTGSDLDSTPEAEDVTSSGSGTDESENEVEQSFHCFTPLSLSQASSFEDIDRRSAEVVAELGNIPIERQVAFQEELLLTDATNACTFLTVLNIQELLSNPQQSIEELRTTMDRVIREGPARFNQVREIWEFYDLWDAMDLLKLAELIPSGSSFEDLMLSNPHWIDMDAELEAAFKKMCDSEAASGCAFTCSPLTFTIFTCHHDGRQVIRIVDTHPVGSGHGGQGTGLIASFYAPLSQPYAAILGAISWIKNRLADYPVDPCTRSSLRKVTLEQ